MADARTIRRRLRDVLAGGLRRADLLILLMHYADGLSDAEIAEVLGGGGPTAVRTDGPQGVGGSPGAVAKRIGWLKVDIAEILKA